MRPSLIAGFAIAAVVLAVCAARAPAREVVRVRLVPPDLEDGDLVFRRGLDAVSRIALSYGPQPRFSHVGVALRIDGSIRVVHAVPRDFDAPGGVRSDPITRFVATDRAADVAYYRVNGLTNEQAERLRRYLIGSIGAPFDYEFKYSDDAAVYCSELVVKALQAAGLNPMADLPTVTGLTLSEPTIPPDALLQFKLLKELAPSSIPGLAGRSHD